MYCIHCGKQIDDRAYVCPHCGVRVSDEVRLSDSQETRRFCTHCGKEIPPQAYICVHCGYRVERDVPTKKNSHIVLAIVSIVLSVLSLTAAGAIAAIFGMTGSVQIKDSKGIKLNGIAIAVCALFSIMTIFMFL